MHQSTKSPLHYDPFPAVLHRWLRDLESRSFHRSGSAAICLGAFAKLGKLDGQAPRVAKGLIRAIRRRQSDELDLWLCSAALRKVVAADPIACAGCADLLRLLVWHRDEVVSSDAAFCLSWLDATMAEARRPAGWQEPQVSSAETALRGPGPKAPLVCPQGSMRRAERRSPRRRTAAAPGHARDSSGSISPRRR